MSSRLRPRSVGPLLGLLLLTGACSRADIEAIDSTRVGFPTIGVGRTGDDVALVFPTCNPQFSRLSLYDQKGHSYWNLRSVDGSSRSFDTITVGSVPAGMQETAPYAQPPVDVVVMLSTSSSDGDLAIKYAEFKVGSLPIDALKVGDSQMPVGEFRKRSACVPGS